jgi:hypothetical protein
VAEMLTKKEYEYLLIRDILFENAVTRGVSFPSRAREVAVMRALAEETDSQCTDDVCNLVMVNKGVLKVHRSPAR